MDEYLYLLPAYFAFGTGGGMLITYGHWWIGVPCVLVACAILVRLLR